MTLWRFFTTRYTDALETQVADLKSQLAIERQEVRRLTEALVPALQWQRIQIDRSVLENLPGKLSNPLEKKPGHQITKAADQQSASCTCGWKAASDDAIELQTAISEHYKESFKPLKAQRPKPSEVIARMEAESLEESQKRPQA